MRSHITWSITFIHWRGLRVRLHMFFLLFAVFTLFLGWKASLQLETRDGLQIAAGSLLILLISTLVHEFAHYYAALRLGGDVEEIVLGPFGGMVSMHPPLDPRNECLMHLAGPATNLFFALLAGGLIAAMTGELTLGILHPLRPTGLVGATTTITALNLTCWINWVLFLVNLLPVFPFDGGRAMRAALFIFKPDTSPRRAAITIAIMAKISALALSILALGMLVWGQAGNSGPVPTWFALLLLAIFLYFSAKQEEVRAEDDDIGDDVFGYDFSQGYTSLERSGSQDDDETDSVGPVRRWLEQRRESQSERQREIEAQEELKVDEILGRLHREGMESLSDEDRSLLKRVSDRYRQRNPESS